MLVSLYSSDIKGIDATPIRVEVDSQVGIPGFHLIGQASSSVTEGTTRVRSALANSGFHLKAKRITINLSPAKIRKDTTAFDLPIALGVAALNGALPWDCLIGTLFVGELGLDGRIRPIRGALAITQMAREEGFKRVVVPPENAMEAALIEGISICIGETLNQVIAALRGEIPWDHPVPPATPTTARQRYDLQEIKGQSRAKRALEIAAAGGHNLLLVGPPGSGKSMLAKRLPSILPPLTPQETLDSTKIYSICGLLQEEALLQERPFRSPHHTISGAGLVGGGTHPRPGEISLAHNGVLFLDELLEFQRSVLESLRQPLEDKVVTISRARGTLRFPSAFQLVGAMNPCPCGHHGDDNRECVCSQRAISSYRGRLSGPLKDRFDLQVFVPALRFRELMRASEEESSATVLQRVLNARERQRHRFEGTPIHNNALMEGAILKQECVIDLQGEKLLESLMEQKGISARGVDRILKVARTIADLAGCERIVLHHLREAALYRILDYDR